ncbi:unnamed protein product [Closterium sp. NIES-54]
MKRAVAAGANVYAVDIALVGEAEQPSGFQKLLAAIPPELQELLKWYRSFEYTVMPFGLTNAPATFQMTMNEAFRLLLDKCVIIYLDNILVYCRDKQQHLADLEAVFKILDEHRLLTKGSKCEFFQDRLEFLGHVISEAGVEIDPKKLDTVKAWHPPTNFTEPQSFLGFVNYVSRFAPDMAHLTAPLMDLLQKGVAFTWGEKEHAAFSALKNVLCSPPVLRFVRIPTTRPLG